MATNTPIYPQTIQGAQHQFTSSSSAEVDLYTAGANGSKIENILVTSTDTSDRVIQLYFSGAAGDYLVATIDVPLSSGNNTAIPAVNLLASVNLPANTDSQGNRYLYLPAGKKLRVAMTQSLTSGKVVNVWAQGGDF